MEAVQKANNAFLLWPAPSQGVLSKLGVCFLPLTSPKPWGGGREEGGKLYYLRRREKVLNFILFYFVLFYFILLFLEEGGSGIRGLER